MILKIYFVDFWPDFDPTNNFFFNLLSKKYELVLDSNPDILFYSLFGIQHYKFTCKKIFYTGENVKPNYNECDYSISFENQTDRNLFFPHFCEYQYFFDFKENAIPPEVIQYQQMPKQKFCSFMASNAKATERIEFVKKLMHYKKVDCSGPVLYNIEPKELIGKFDPLGQVIDWRKEKLETIQHYKFTIAFENERTKNYVTEKIFQPLLVKSIPIYWGAPNIGEYFNPKAFINIADYATFEDAIEEISRIDQNEELYNSYLEATPILSDSKIEPLNEHLILNWFENLIKDKSQLVSQKNKLLLLVKYFFTYNFLQVKKIAKKLLKK